MPEAKAGASAVMNDVVRQVSGAPSVTIIGSIMNTFAETGCDGRHRRIAGLRGTRLGRWSHADRRPVRRTYGYTARDIGANTLCRCNGDCRTRHRNSGTWRSHHRVPLAPGPRARPFLPLGQMLLSRTMMWSHPGRIPVPGKRSRTASALTHSSRCREGNRPFAGCNRTVTRLRKCGETAEPRRISQ